LSLDKVTIVKMSYVVHVVGIRLGLIPTSATHTHTHTHYKDQIIIYAATSPNEPLRCILTHFNNCNFSEAQI